MLRKMKLMIFLLIEIIFLMKTTQCFEKRIQKRSYTTELFVQGQVICDFKPCTEEGTVIELWDDELLIDTHMGSTKADRNGYFNVGGWASEIIGDIDPYLKIKYNSGKSDEFIQKVNLPEVSGSYKTIFLYQPIKLSKNN